MSEDRNTAVRRSIKWGLLQNLLFCDSRFCILTRRDAAFLPNKIIPFFFFLKRFARSDIRFFLLQAGP